MTFTHIDRSALAVDPALDLAATYNRIVKASVARIWENVFDWEHLPVLHETYFNRVELLERGANGWRVELSKQPGRADRLMTLELRTDKAWTRYRVQTLAGDGAGSEIWTLMKPLEGHRTEIEVRYYLPEKRPERKAVLGDKFRGASRRLWDEDEAMMQRRQQLADAPPRRRRASAGPVLLGKIDEVMRRLPLLANVEGEAFRIVAIDGQLHAHATLCPHWLGPLESADVENGCIRCPWHGYLFDVRTGCSADDRGLRLDPAPRVAVDPFSGDVTLVSAS